MLTKLRIGSVGLTAAALAVAAAMAFALAPAAGAQELPPEGECEGQVPIVVASDEAAQADLSAAVMLAGALDTSCVVLAGARDGTIVPAQLARLRAARPDGFVVGGPAAVPERKVDGHDLARLAGVDRWHTARLAGAVAANPDGDVALLTARTARAASARRGTTVTVDGRQVSLPPGIDTDCAGQAPVVVADDVASQSDLYVATTLAGVLDTSCIVLAGARVAPIDPAQRARLDAAGGDGWIVGGEAAVLPAKVADFSLIRLAGANRWHTARLVGAVARAPSSDVAQRAIEAALGGTPVARNSVLLADASVPLQQALAGTREHFNHPRSVRYAGQVRPLTIARVNSWLRLDGSGEGARIEIDPATVQASLAELFNDTSSPDGPAVFTIDYSSDPTGVPKIVNADGHIKCCTPESTQRLIDMLVNDVGGTLTLDGMPAISVEEHARLSALGIVERVATFTTPHKDEPYPSRVTNIQRMADLVRGTVVAPGVTFSLNAHVGQRTWHKGFVPGGVISHESGGLGVGIGGGVSQFATTAFNAAFFAGLDIPLYQMHSLYFPRYPFGREATINYKGGPDLRLRNNTDYGVLLWTRYTPTSITVDIYSTKNVWVTPEPTSFVWSDEPCRNPTSDACRAAVASPQATSQRGWCKVETTRTRTYANGSSEDDTFTNRYGNVRGCG